MTGLAHRGWRLNDYGKHLVNTLRKAGYVSALSGVQHIARPSTAEVEEIGYDELLTDKGPAEDITATAERFISSPPGKPFFLSVGYFETHRPYPTEGLEDDPRYVRPPRPTPDTPATRRDMCGFMSLARRLDSNVGSVLDSLERAGLADNTLVICTTDHGIAFPGMKCNLTDDGTGVMLIMRGPGGCTGGKVIDGMVSHVDVYPTLCELLGIDAPDWLEGESVMPLVRGEAEQVHDAIYSEVNYHAAYEPMRAVRTPTRKYIRRYVDGGLPVLPNADDSPSKDLWMSAGWPDRAVPSERLYDLTIDPAERCNLAADDAYADDLVQCRALLADWMMQTDDPLLSGKVPAPKGARVNPSDGVSPNEPTDEA